MPFNEKFVGNAARVPENSKTELSSSSVAGPYTSTVHKKAPPHKPAQGTKPVTARQGTAATQPAEAARPGKVQFSQGGAAALASQRSIHTRQSVWRTPVFRFIGEYLYTVGFTFEYWLVIFGRVLRNIGAVVWQVLAWLFGGLFRALGSAISNLAHDIAAPFKRFAKGMANISRVMADARKRGDVSASQAAAEYFRRGVKDHAHLLKGLVGVLLPLAAMGIFAVTVYTFTHTEYALAVEVNGQVIGHVTDQGVLEDAKSMLRSRLRLADGQTMADWQFSPTLTVSRTENYTTKQQLVNEILRASSTDITPGTAIYFGEELWAVTTEGEDLKAFLDSVLAQYYDPETPDAIPSFVDNITCEPNPDDVFFTSSVRPYDELIAELSSTAEPEITYESVEGDTLGKIAFNHGLLVDTLIARNPSFEGQSASYRPEAGTHFLIERARPFLEVQKSMRVMVTETIPYREIIQETDELALGVRRPSVVGENGLQEVWYDEFYINGELQREVRVDELTNVLKAPVNQVTLVGTRDMASIGSGAGYSSAYYWPVPDFAYSSRGMGGGHRGRDINGAYGTAIYACNAGVVLEAGWHYSYGNYIVIEHPDGLRTLYAHCSALAVTAGQVVDAGQYIAAMGSTGNSTGNHLHLEFQDANGALLNPDNYVAPPNGWPS